MCFRTEDFEFDTRAITIGYHRATSQKIWAFSCYKWTFL